MLIFSKNGFVSIVQHNRLVDSLLVRARFEGDIEALIPNAEVRMTEYADYLYRTTILKERFSDIMRERVMGIDYDDFNYEA